MLGPIGVGRADVQVDRDDRPGLRDCNAVAANRADVAASNAAQPQRDVVGHRRGCDREAALLELGVRRACRCAAVMAVDDLVQKIEAAQNTVQVLATHYLQLWHIRSVDLDVVNTADVLKRPRRMKRLSNFLPRSPNDASSSAAFKK